MSNPSDRGGARLEQRFRSTAKERLAKLESAISAHVDGEPDAMQELRGELHTLKGEARIVGFSAIARLVHLLEERVAHSETIADADLATLLEGISLVHELLTFEAAAGSEAVDGFEMRLAGSSRASRGPSAAPSSLAFAPARAEDFVRVDLASLSRLTRTSGELRLAERELTDWLGAFATLVDELSNDQQRARASRRTAVDARDSELLARLRRLAEHGQQIAFEHHLRLDSLTDRVRELRLVPLGSVLEPFPRAVRQLAQQLQKEVEVRAEGMDVYVDKHVLDVLSEPLLHLVRNAVDHGIETAAVRIAAGKPGRGTITLRARSTGAMVRIDVEDDGRGVDVEAVRDALRVRGAIHVEQLALDGRELLDQLCLAGMSTREEVSEISGRGIGLDIVRRRTESVGGQLHLHTRSGEGTRFTLEVPTSTVLGAMIGVEVDGSRYAFAPHEVEQVLETRECEIASSGEGIVARVADRSIALLDLAALLAGQPTDPRERAAILVLRHTDRRIAVGIDRSHGMSSVLQQRLDPFLEGITVMRSAALLATGELAIVLDVPELMRRAEGSERVQERAATAGRDRPRVLVVDDSELTRDVVTGVLRDLGMDVVEAVNGRQALERIASRRPQLVLTDLDMPVLDGFELLRQIRSNGASEMLPVVVISTRGTREDVKRASELGADAYLIKSGLDFDELRRVVRRFVEVRT